MVTAALVCLAKAYSFEISVRDMSIALSLGVFQVGVGLTISLLARKLFQR